MMVVINYSILVSTLVMEVMVEKGLVLEEKEKALVKEKRERESGGRRRWPRLLLSAVLPLTKSYNC
jgi:hypothetical protein